MLPPPPPIWLNLPRPGIDRRPSNAPTTPCRRDIRSQAAAIISRVASRQSPLRPVVRGPSVLRPWSVRAVCALSVLVRDPTLLRLQPSVFASVPSPIHSRFIRAPAVNSPCPVRDLSVFLSCCPCYVRALASPVFTVQSMLSPYSVRGLSYPRPVPSPCNVEWMSFRFYSRSCMLKPVDMNIFTSAAMTGDGSVDDTVCRS